jgi:hypothetical protein
MLSKGFWNHPGLTIMVNGIEVLPSESRSLELVSSLVAWDLFIKRFISVTETVARAASLKYLLAAQSVAII